MLAYLICSLLARFDKRCEASVIHLLPFTCDVILWLLETTDYILDSLYMH